MNKILKEDLDSIIQSDIEFQRFKNKTILITGATGLIGSLLVKSFLYFNDILSLNTKIIALVRNLEKAEAVFENYNLNCLEFYQADLAEDKIQMNGKIDYIIHAAAVTTSKTMVMDPVGTIRTSFNGTSEMLNLAEKNKVESMLYVSSMEIYGTMSSEEKTTENKLGFIDLSSVRSCYPESKRLCECLCNSYCIEYQVPVKIARLAQTFGAGVLPTDNRVFMQFARSAMAGKDIVLHTKGTSDGNYVYTSDAVCALLKILLDGENGQSYNVVNEATHITIAEMADMICEKVAGGKIKVVFDIPQDANQYGYAPTTKLALSSEKIRKLGWKAKVNLTEMYQRLCAFLRDSL